MKFQLNLQRELNERADEEKNSKLKIESLTSKLKNAGEKKRKLQAQVEEQRLKLEKLMLFGGDKSKVAETSDAYLDNVSKSKPPSQTSTSNIETLSNSRILSSQATQQMQEQRQDQ